MIRFTLRIQVNGKNLIVICARGLHNQVFCHNYDVPMCNLNFSRTR